MSMSSLRYLLGNIIYAGAQFVIIILLNKFGSPEIVGQYSLGLAVTAPIYMLSHFHLRSVLIVDSSGKYEVGDYIGLRLMTTCAAFMITICISFLGGFNHMTQLVICMISMYRVIESMSDILLGILQKQERLDQITICRTSKGLVSTIIFALIFIPTHNLILSLLIQVIGWLMITLWFDLRMAKASASINPSFHWKRLSRLLLLSSPLGIVLAFMSLNTNLPQYAIAYFVGEYELGVFASFSYLIVACNVVVTALGEAITPRLARYNAEGKHKEFIKLVSRMIAAGIGLSLVACLVGWLFGQQILSLIYRAELAQETELFRLFLVSTVFVFVSSYLWYALTSTGKYLPQIPLFLATVISNALACYYLVPPYGAVGAAIGSMISLTVQMLGSIAVLYWVLARAQRQKSPGIPDRPEEPLQRGMA